MSVFTADFSTNYLGSISCETSSPLLLLVWVARTKLNSKTNLERFSSLPSIFEYLGKETKNTAELVIIKNIFIYARVCVNKEVIHSGSLGLISGKHARYVIVRVSYVKSCNELAVEGPCNTSCFKIVDSLLPMLKPLKPILFVETPNAYREFPRRSAHALISALFRTSVHPPGLAKRKTDLFPIFGKVSNKSMLNQISLHLDLILLMGSNCRLMRSTDQYTLI